MTHISGRSGGMSKLPSLADADDPNDPATLAETIAQASLTATDGAAATPVSDEPTTSQTARDVKASEASLAAVDERHDVASAAGERDAKRTVGGRSQGIPQALGEKGDNEGSLSPAAIAAHIGRVRI